MHNKQAGATLQLLTHAGEQRWAPSEAGVTPGTAAGGGSAGTGSSQRRAQLSCGEWGWGKL